MAAIVANTTVVGPFTPEEGTGVNNYASLVAAVDTEIATADDSWTVIVEYVKAGEQSEALYAFVTSHTGS